MLMKCVGKKLIFSLFFLAIFSLWNWINRARRRHNTVNSISHINERQRCEPHLSIVYYPLMSLIYHPLSLLLHQIICLYPMNYGKMCANLCKFPRLPNTLPSSIVCISHSLCSVMMTMMMVDTHAIIIILIWVCINSDCANWHWKRV